MIKFGGPGKKRQACILRKCSMMTYTDTEAKQVLMEESSKGKSVATKNNTETLKKDSTAGTKEQIQYTSIEVSEKSTESCQTAATRENMVWMNAAQYLFKYQRGIEAIKGDGNCLFHALSRICVATGITIVLCAGYLLLFLHLTKQYYRNSATQYPLRSISMQ